jgi:hypothetical protein
MHDGEKLGVGLIDRRTRSLAFVSLRSPWAREAERGKAAERPEPAKVRVRWRLEAYGGESAADELRRLLVPWEEMRRSRRQTLRITASGARAGSGSGSGETLDLRFAWAKR